LRYDTGGFTVHYFDHVFPVSPCTYGQVLNHRVEELEAELGKEAEALLEYKSICTAVAHLPSHTATEPEKVAERQREKEVIKRRRGASTTPTASTTRGSTSSASRTASSGRRPGGWRRQTPPTRGRTGTKSAGRCWRSSAGGGPTRARSARSGAPRTGTGMGTG